MRVYVCIENGYSKGIDSVESWNGIIIWSKPSFNTNCAHEKENDNNNKKKQQQQNEQEKKRIECRKYFLYF